MQGSQVRAAHTDATNKPTTTAPATTTTSQAGATSGSGQPAPTKRNAPIVGGRKNEAVENVRLAAAGDATQKGGGGGQANTGASTGQTNTQATSGVRPAIGNAVVTGAGVSTTLGAPARGAGTTTTQTGNSGQTGRTTTTAMGAVTVGGLGQPAIGGATTTGVAAKGQTKTGSPTNGSVVVAPSGRQLKIESKKVVENVKTRAVVERTVQTQRTENTVAVQQTATIVKAVTETVHKAAVQTAVRVAEVQVATQSVTTTVQHQQNKAGTQKVAQKAEAASADMAATQQASVVLGERMMASAPGVTTTFRSDGTLARSSAPDPHLDPASDKELETLSQGLSRVDVIEMARAFAENDHGVDLGSVVRAQRESDVQDAFFRETQASTVSLGSHAAPPFSNVSVALDRKLELNIELTREERSQMKSQGAPYANADDGAVSLSLGGAKAIEEMSSVLSLDLGLEVSELGDSMRTLMDSDGGGDDGGGDGGGDEGGGGGDSGSGGGD